MSFQFGDDYVAASIETQKEVAEGYSAITGFFRQYELIYILADERDVIRLRTNVRTGGDVYLFHAMAAPELTRKPLYGPIFLVPARPIAVETAL